VIHEDALRVELSVKAPDYCFRVGGQRMFLVEAKKPAANIKDDFAPAFQLRVWITPLTPPVHMERVSTARLQRLYCVQSSGKHVSYESGLCHLRGKSMATIGERIVEKAFSALEATLEGLRYSDLVRRVMELDG
jgi:hypothetical protein